MGMKAELRKSAERQLTVLDALDVGDVELLESGILPTDGRIRHISESTGIEEWICRNDVNNYLYWRKGTV